ncbi:hypothetical protein EVAR_31838_1 [Eumeta japonica]|uniref:Uncharacterized protein n=1 Tax=Eumeta variegata TaxID=151549 RepID=A0A4C1WJC3_EUMVA|nr:hypothetical protein EVAR_31838_1 [Eumeta japonica]
MNSKRAKRIQPNSHDNPSCRPARRHHEGDHYSRSKIVTIRLNYQKRSSGDFVTDQATSYVGQYLRGPPTRKPVRTEHDRNVERYEYLLVAFYITAPLGRGRQSEISLNIFQLFLFHGPVSRDKVTMRNSALTQTAGDTRMEDEIGVKIEIGIENKSLIAIEILKMKELFSSGFVLIETVSGSAYQSQFQSHWLIP